MTFAIDHLTDDQLAALVAGEAMDAGLEYHVAHCMDCKRRLAGALLLGGLFRPLGDAAGNHLGTPDLDRLHAVLFEGDDSEGFNLLREYRHVRSCDPCFTKFFNLHAQLSPSTLSIERAKRAFADSLPARPLGRLTVGTVLKEAWLTFQAELEELTEKTGVDALLRALASKDRRGREGRLARPQGSVRPGRPVADFESATMSAERSVPEGGVDDLVSLDLQSAAYVPAPPTGETVTIGNLKLILDVTVDDDQQLFIQVAAMDAESGAPRTDVSIELLSGVVALASSSTGADGRCSLELPNEADRLLVRRVGVDDKPWEIKLQFDSPGL